MSSRRSHSKRRKEQWLIMGSYQEMITHLAMNAHPNPEKVLVIGGGDGGVLREVVKHDCVKEAVLCDIDEAVIRLSKQYLPGMSVSSTQRPPPSSVTASSSLRTRRVSSTLSSLTPATRRVLLRLSSRSHTSSCSTARSAKAVSFPPKVVSPLLASSVLYWLFRHHAPVGAA
jgi:hypothetical protein